MGRFPRGLSRSTAKALPSALIAVASCILGVALAALVVSDLRSRRLPDIITLPLILLGFLVSLLLPGRPILDHLIGPLAGALSLWLVAIAYEQLRHHKGLGMGDVKLFAAAGAWLGWQALPLVMLLAVLVMLFGMVIARLLGSRFTQETQLPLGAGIAPAIFVMWLLEVGGLHWLEF